MTEHAKIPHNLNHGTKMKFSIKDFFGFGHIY